ncbi:MAG: preprotein translocase subunit SecE [Candidatus Nealsonbacteria bacterium]|nr:preprotein translocase subunit SecE [Candidatus Nealsonbacteria bacterium]
MNISGLGNKLGTFLKEVRLEIRKINWPTRQETVKYTIIVISVSFVVAAFLGGLDFVFSYLLQLALFK